MEHTLPAATIDDVDTHTNGLVARCRLLLDDGRQHERMAAIRLVRVDGGDSAHAAHPLDRWQVGASLLVERP